MNYKEFLHKSLNESSNKLNGNEYKKANVKLNKAVAITYKLDVVEKLTDIPSESISNIEKNFDGLKLTYEKKIGRSWKTETKQFEFDKKTVESTLTFNGVVSLKELESVLNNVRNHPSVLAAYKKNNKKSKISIVSNRTDIKLPEADRFVGDLKVYANDKFVAMVDGYKIDPSISINMSTHPNEKGEPLLRNVSIYASKHNASLNTIDNAATKYEGKDLTIKWNPKKVENLLLNYVIKAIEKYEEKFSKYAKSYGDYVKRTGDVS